jgi:hypothetical protein
MSKEGTGVPDTLAQLSWAGRAHTLESLQKIERAINARVRTQ